MLEENHSLGQLILKEVTFLLREREEQIIASIVRAYKGTYKGKAATNESVWMAFAGIAELRIIQDRLQMRVKEQERETQEVYSNTEKA